MFEPRSMLSFLTKAKTLEQILKRCAVKLLIKKKKTKQPRAKNRRMSAYKDNGSRLARAHFFPRL